MVQLFGVIRWLFIVRKTWFQDFVGSTVLSIGKNEVWTYMIPDVE